LLEELEDDNDDEFEYMFESAEEIEGL